MKKLASCFLANVLVTVALYVSASLAAEVPSQIFSINNATVGVTTLDEVGKIYGMAEPSRASRDDEADVTVCYVHSSSGGESFLIFESGVMGGGHQITGFKLSTLRPKENCVPTKIDVGSLATENGVRLWQGLEAFEKAIPVEFKQCGSELIYESVSQRAATKEELIKLRANWPNEKQENFDVTTTIKAKFQDNKLIDFYVHKIESY